MRLLFFILLIIILPFFSYSITPFSLSPLGLALAEAERGTEDDFEFPPITLPVADDTLIKANNMRIIFAGGAGTLTGIGFMIYGIIDILGLIEEGYFTYEIGHSLFFISTGLIITGISVSFLTPAIDSFL
ncbi:MAG: hypothetical protein JXJ04_04685 [Spirochaetales bacterium]|nr:hypothetical protein [Spirochaetales bacterium]